MEEGDTLNASLLDEECPESGALSVYSLVKLNAFIVGWSALDIFARRVASKAGSRHRW